MLTGSIIGTFIGILPGIGGRTASCSPPTYRYADLQKAEFGTGCTEGLVASGNGKQCLLRRCLIPMLHLAQNLVTALLLGGLVVHGPWAAAVHHEYPCDRRHTCGVFPVEYFYVRDGNGADESLHQAAEGADEPPVPHYHGHVRGGHDHRKQPAVRQLGPVCGGNRRLHTDCAKFPLPPIVIGFILGSIIENNFRTALIANQGQFHEPVQQTDCSRIPDFLRLSWWRSPLSFLKCLQRKRRQRAYEGVFHFERSA